MNVKSRLIQKIASRKRLNLDLGDSGPLKLPSNLFEDYPHLKPSSSSFSSPGFSSNFPPLPPLQNPSSQDVQDRISDILNEDYRPSRSFDSFPPRPPVSMPQASKRPDFDKEDKEDKEDIDMLGNVGIAGNLAINYKLPRIAERLYQRNAGKYLRKYEDKQTKKDLVRVKELSGKLLEQAVKSKQIKKNFDIARGDKMKKIEILKGKIKETIEDTPEQDKLNLKNWGPHVITMDLFKKPHQRIVLGDKSTAATEAHELGHTMAPEWLITRLAKKVMKNTGGAEGGEILGNRAGILASGLQGLAQKEGLPLKAQLALAALPVLPNLPTLIEEARASLNADRLLRESGVTPEELKQSRKDNLLAYSTYLANPVVNAGTLAATAVLGDQYQKYIRGLNG